MVDPPPPRPPWLVAEDMGNILILAELAMILADHFHTVRKEGASLSEEKRSGRGIHFFLSQMALGVDLVPGLEKVTLVGFDLDGMVHLMHSLFSVWVDIYLTSRRLFACLGKLPVERYPPVVEIPHKAFAVRRSVRAVP